MVKHTPILLMACDHVQVDEQVHAPAGRPASRYAGQPARASAAPALDHGTFCKKKW